MRETTLDPQVKENIDNALGEMESKVKEYCSNAELAYKDTSGNRWVFILFNHNPSKEELKQIQRAYEEIQGKFMWPNTEKHEWSVNNQIYIRFTIIDDYASYIMCSMRGWKSALIASHPIFHYLTFFSSWCVGVIRERERVRVSKCVCGD